MKPDLPTLVCGVLAWMSAEDVAPTRTRLVKFLFLADLQWARHHDGETITGWSWKVDSFGPMAVEFYRATEAGCNAGWLTCREPEDGGRHDDPEGGTKPKFYRAARKVAEDALVGIGQVRRWIKQYGDDTPRLLRFVYGTEVMSGVRAGDRLDFRRARPVDVTPLPSKPIREKDRKRLRSLLASMREEYETAAELNESIDGPLDAVFHAELPQEEPLTKSSPFTLKFDSEA